jgi:YD repeat-containing protein
MGNTWAYTYDVAGRRISANDPDLGNWTYAYDAAGRLTTQTDAKAAVSTLAYDAIGRVTSKTVTASGLAQELTTNIYDQPRASYFNFGQLTSASRSVAAQTLNRVAIPAVGVVQSFDHDLAGRRVKDTHGGVNGNVYTLETEYWPDGLVKRRKQANGQWTGEYRYDMAGRLASFDNANAASASEPDLFIQSQSYNARGQTTSITYGDGTSTAFTYNDARDFLSRVLSTKSATAQLDQTYARNAKGMVTSITSPQVGNNWTYTYDGLDRLVTADNDTNSEDKNFAYDDADNMIWNSGLPTSASRASAAQSALQSGTAAGWHGDRACGFYPSALQALYPHSVPESCSRSCARYRTRGTALPSSRPQATGRQTSRVHPSRYTPSKASGSPRKGPKV